MLIGWNRTGLRPSQGTAFMLNLAYILENSAREFPDKTAVVFGAMRLTYSEIDRMACQVANGLVSAGIQPGDKVALTCPNIPYFPILYYGILKAGAVVVPLNVLFKRREVAYRGPGLHLLPGHRHAAHGRGRAGRL